MATAGVIALILLSFADVLFLGKSFYVRDVARIYYPERKVFRDIVLGGEFPFWNPHYAAGQPLAANPTSEVFYPPQWLSLLPDFQEGVAFEIVLHYAIGALGMFMFLRALGLARAASTFGSFVFAFSGLLRSLASLLPCLFAFAWFPWVGWAIERWLRRRHASDFCVAAFFLGIVVLIGEPASILQAGALSAAYIIVRMRTFRGFMLAALLCVAATLVGAGQVIPGIDHQSDSGRAGGLPYNEVTLQSMSPARPLELIDRAVFGNITRDAMYFWSSDIPWIFGWYAGVFPAALILAGFAQRLRGWIFVAAVTVICYFVALGKFSPLFPLLYRLGLRSIRFPEKWFMPGAFVLIVFAAIAADRFANDAAFRRTTQIACLLLVAFDSLVLAFAWSPYFARVWNLRGYFEDILYEARGGALTGLATAAALALVLLFRDRPSIAFPLLGILVVADLGPYAYGLTPRIDRHYYDAPPIARGLPAGARIYNDADWRLTLLPQPHIGDSERWTRLRNAMRPETQSLWGFDSVFEIDVTETMLKPTRELSREFWRSQLTGHPEETRRLLMAAGATHVIALRDAQSATQPVTVIAIPGSRRWHVEGNARILAARQTANTIEFEIEASSPAALFISVTRHKYWRATIDGTAATIQPAYIAFQSIALPPGRHHVALRYRNPLVMSFGFVSLFSAAALLAAHFVAEHRRRRGDVERLDAA